MPRGSSALPVKERPFSPMIWTRTHSIPFALVRRLLPCFCLAISLAASDSLALSNCNWTDADSTTLSQILSMLNDGQSAWSAHSRIQTIIDYLDSVTFNSNGVTWLRVPTPSTSGGGECKFEPYDDVWLKLFLTGTEAGSSTDTPIFRYGGNRAGGSYPSQQNLQYFLSLVLGQNVWQSSTAVTWDNAFCPGVSGTGSNLGGSYSFFNVWLAEAMRRLISTNQLIATTNDRNTRSIEENLSLILMQLRDMTNSVSVTSPDVSVTVSPVVDIPAVNVTNEVTIAADYAPSLDDPALTNVSGEVSAASYVAPDTDAFVNEDMRLTQDLGNPVLTLWEGVRLGDVSLPDAKIDFNSSQHGAAIRNASEVLRSISISVWWLLYYLALGILLRREYVYYTSLGHTEGAA